MRVIQLVKAEPTNCEIDDETVIWIAIPDSMEIGIIGIASTEWTVTDTDYDEIVPGVDFVVREVSATPAIDKDIPLDSIEIPSVMINREEF